jgi:hypothetical protein
MEADSYVGKDLESIIVAKSRHHPGIFKDKLKKIMMNLSRKSRCLGRDLHQASP